MSAPQLSIVIVSWNVRDLLRACLHSLPPAGPACEVIVVDSASADGTPAMVAAEFPEVRLIASPDNLGYSRGNNLGLRLARGRHVLILNPDTVVTAGALERLSAYLDAHPETGVVGPQLVYGDGAPQSTRRRFPTVLTGFFESTWAQGWAPPGLLQRYYAADLPADQPVAVDWLVGAALLVRAEVVAQVGGFDEGFFMYSEELDWCRRIRAAGWRIAHVPAARILHYEGRSSAQAPAATHIRFNASKVRYYRKHHGPLVAEALRLWLLAQFAGQLALEALKGLAGHRRALRRERVRVYWQVLRSGLRPVRP